LSSSLYKSLLSKTPLAPEEAIHLGSLSPGVLQQLRARLSELPSDGYISRKELATLTEAHFAERLRLVTNDLSNTEREVLQSIRANTLISKGPEEDEILTTGQRLADRISRFGGSWLFIILFLIFILMWLALNLATWLGSFDPYPFILLNLVLSCVAAMQAPIILMSQNRKEEKDRQRSINDYKVNLKAELEIQELHEKMERLLTRLDGQRQPPVQRPGGSDAPGFGPSKQ